MNQPRGDAGLLLEALAHSGQSFGVGMEDLDRDSPLQPFVEGVEHPRHAALAKLSVDQVPMPDDAFSRLTLHPCCVPGTSGG